MATPATFTVHSAPVSAMDPVTLYRVLALRVDVFVVEQECIYRELDARDLEPGARLVWAERDGEVVATLRMLAEYDGCVRIGRVATAPSARGAGVAGELILRAIALAGTAPVVLDAQSHLVQWYSRYGFVRDGADFVEDDIPHTPMRRDGGPATESGPASS